MLKKIAFISFVLTSLLFIGCSDDNDDSKKFTIDKNSISLHYEETDLITASEVATWETESEFVAKVDDNGLVTGNHVGKTTIIATSPKGSAKCEVEVTPVYSTYIEPVLDFKTATTSAVKAKEKRELAKEEKASLAFKGENPFVDLVMYLFDDNGKLESSAVLLSLTAGSELTKFLLERYQPAAKDDDKYIFLNEKRDLYVVFSIVKGSLFVMYAPRTETKTNQIEELLSTDMESIFYDLKNR